MLRDEQSGDERDELKLGSEGRAEQDRTGIGDKLSDQIGGLAPSMARHLPPLKGETDSSFLPPALRLHKVIDGLLSRIKPVINKQLLEDGEESLTDREVHATLKKGIGGSMVNLSIENVDQVVFTDVWSQFDASCVEFGLELFRDGEPYVFDGHEPEPRPEDLGVNRYNLVILRDRPPFLARADIMDRYEDSHSEYIEFARRYLDSVREGIESPPYTLTGDEIGSLVEVLIENEGKFIEDAHY